MTARGHHGALVMLSGEVVGRSYCFCFESSLVVQRCIEVRREQLNDARVSVCVRAGWYYYQLSARVG